jgi:peptidyl-prolyl cis-trans isomerase SurA
MNVGDISVPQSFETPSGEKGFRIFKLNKRTEPHTMDLVKDYPLVNEAAEGDARQKVIDEWITERIDHIYVRIISDYAGCQFKYPWVKRPIP